MGERSTASTVATADDEQLDVAPHPDVHGSATDEVVTANEEQPPMRHGAPRDEPPTRSSFLRWSVAMVLTAIVVLVVASLVRTEGHFAYLLDDTAIHLSVARNLTEHGTWGVNAGHYESASSSPLWTLLIAAVTFVMPAGDHLAPLMLSTTAVVGALAVLARAQDLLRPAWRRPLDIAATAVLVLVVLFLPVLGVMGMEHAFHIAVLLAAMHLVTLLDIDDAPPKALAAACVILATASLVRFEMLFVAVGIGVGLLATSTAALSPTHLARPLSGQVRRAVLFGSAVGGPIAAYGAFNLAMGQSFFPNSVVGKSALSHAGLVPSPYDTWQALSRDPAVLILLVAAIAYLIHAASGRSRRAVLPAITFVVTVLLHSSYADYGWFDRYQAYLIALGVYACLRMASEVTLVPSTRRVVLVAIILIGLLVTPIKFQLLETTPYSSQNTYSERYQLGRFLQRYYQGRPVATGELGYASLFHEGPIVDWFGLGDHEVLQAALAAHGFAPTEYWKQRLAHDRVEVIVNYSGVMGPNPPKEWTFIGEWRLHQPLPYGRENDLHLVFYAPAPQYVEPLKRNFEDFRPQLPKGVEAICWACLQGLAPG